MAKVTYDNIPGLTLECDVFLGNGADDKRPLEERVKVKGRLGWTFRNGRPRINVFWDKVNKDIDKEVNFIIAPFNPVPCMQFLENVIHYYTISLKNKNFNKAVNVIHKNVHDGKEFKQAETKFKYEYRNGVYYPTLVIKCLRHGHTAIADLSVDKNWYTYGKSMFRN